MYSSIKKNSTSFIDIEGRWTSHCEIDSDELGKIMSQISKQMGTMPPSREDIKEIFDNIDTDHSGEIDFDEFQVLIKNVLTSMMLDEEDDSDDE